MATGIDRHLERLLGQIARGWKVDGAPSGLSIVQFVACPRKGVVTYATLGLSRHTLDLLDGREVRLELLLAVEGAHAEPDLVGCLVRVAEIALRGHRALLRGEVIELGSPVWSGATLDRLYVSAPVVFADALAVCDETEPPTVLAWLVPIHANEAHFVVRVGWEAFEDELERVDPNLFDWTRGSIVPPLGDLTA